MIGHESFGQIENEMISEIRRKRYKIQKMLQRKNELDIYIEKVEAFLLKAKKERDALTSKIKTEMKRYKEMKKHIDELSKGDKEKEEDDFGIDDEFKRIEREVMKKFSKNKVAKTKFPPTPIKGDRRKSIVIIDLPNLIHSYRLYNERHGDRNKVQFTASVMKLLLKKYVYDIYGEENVRVEIFTNDTYDAVNGDISDWLEKTDKEIHMHIVESNDYDHDGVDNAIINRIYAIAKALENPDVLKSTARILLFSGDHIYLTPLRLIMEKQIHCHVIAFYGSLHHDYIKAASEFDDLEYWTENGEKIIDFYYVNNLALS